MHVHTDRKSVARVKKIIAMDEDIAQCSTTAAFAISIATVGYIRTFFYLACANAL